MSERIEITKLKAKLECLKTAAKLYPSDDPNAINTIADTFYMNLLKEIDKTEE